MQDKPPANLLIVEVQRALEQGLATKFEQKMAAGALAIAARELEQAGAYASAERVRLNALVGTQGDLSDRNERMVELIREGSLTCDERVITHLIRTTIEKLEIDQPGYPAFKQWKESQ